MLEFIVCDDNVKVSTKINNIIDTLMFDNNINYEVKIFNDYDKKFNSYIKNKRGNVIYVLDIVTPSGSGIDAAREIRKKDVESVIIFLTGHEELGMTILKDELFFLTFINKYDNYEYRLNKSLKKALTILGNKQMLKFSDNNCIYIISLNEILYIYKDKSSRKTTIVTDNNKIVIGKTLKYIKKLIPNNFCYSGRNSIINKDRINCIDKTNKKIIFDNNETMNLVSKQFLGEEIC